MAKSSVGKNVTMHLPSKWVTSDELMKSMRQTRFPRDTALAIEPGSTVYRGVATALSVAGVEVLLMAKNRDELHIAYNKITNFAPYSAGATRNAALTSVDALTLDDEL